MKKCVAICHSLRSIEICVHIVEKGCKGLFKKKPHGEVCGGRGDQNWFPWTALILPMKKKLKG